jgi:rfaE bifunctional protein kinase chain/domain
LNAHGGNGGVGVREAIASLPGHRVLVVGDVMLDRTLEGEVERVSPEAPVPVLHRTREHTRPGGAANVATNVTALGGTADLVGLAGRDEAGRELCAELMQAGVEGSRLVDAERRTTVKTRVVAARQHIVRIDDEDTAPADTDETAQLIQTITEAVREADAVVLSDYAKGVVTPQVAAATLGAAAQLGLPTIVDPQRRDFAPYQGASVVVPNRLEALAAAMLDGSASVVDAGPALLARNEVGAVLITLGEEGMMLFERGREPVSISSRARSVYDVTGAGDTVVATLGLALGAGVELAMAAWLATLAAGTAVEQLLTAAVTEEALQAAAGS